MYSSKESERLNITDNEHEWLEINETNRIQRISLSNKTIGE